MVRQQILSKVREAVVREEQYDMEIIETGEGEDEMRGDDDRQHEATIIMRMKSDKLYLATTWEWFLDNVALQHGNVYDYYIAEAGVTSVRMSHSQSRTEGNPLGTRERTYLTRRVLCIRAMLPQFHRRVRSYEYSRALLKLH